LDSQDGGLAATLLGEGDMLQMGCNIYS
jgi:hypothetical protein